MRLKRESIRVDGPAGRMKLVILRPRKQAGPLPGILWIHGGGYASGQALMVMYSIGRLLAMTYGAVVVSPEYRKSHEAPYPAALDDCLAALNYLYEHAEEMNIDRKKIIVGGESAGGGLAAAVCLANRDRGQVPVTFQLPLYPMLDCRDTESSRDNHGRGWNTRRNHKGWQLYLGGLYGTDGVPKYASPALETDYSGLPPCYTYVTEGEPFRDETLSYVRRLREAGVEADADVYPGNIHGFDALLWTRSSKTARRKLLQAAEKYF